MDGIDHSLDGEGFLPMGRFSEGIELEKKIGVWYRVVINLIWRTRRKADSKLEKCTCYPQTDILTLRDERSGYQLPWHCHAYQTTKHHYGLVDLMVSSKQVTWPLLKDVITIAEQI